MGIAVSLEQRNSNYILCSLIKSLVVSVFVLLFGFSTTANTRTPSQALPDFFKKYNQPQFYDLKKKKKKKKKFLKN